MTHETLDLLRLTIGPFHYELHAQDAWGTDALERLRGHVVCLDFLCTPDRMVHVAALPMTQHEHEQIMSGALPDRFDGLLPADAPHTRWQVVEDQTGYLIFLHPDTRHALWILGVSPNHHRAAFQLPWPLVLADCVARNGGILHGGLIVNAGAGFVLTAPPGGGKTTSIARLPVSWNILADDACLIWPTGDNTFLASPLPTWSVLLGRGKVLDSIGRWKLAVNVPIAGIILLHKGIQDRITQSTVLQALPALYRALCEHPFVVTNRAPHSVDLFDLARGLARTTPVWSLETTLDGQFWELLSDLPSPAVADAQ